MHTVKEIVVVQMRNRFLLNMFKNLSNPLDEHICLLHVFPWWCRVKTVSVVVTACLSCRPQKTTLELKT